ncbi:MAG: nucleotidyltransferase domain-containing protein [Solirubrobacteraceae bacterium]
MAALAQASLSRAERAATEELVAAVCARFGARLRAVWLYGSRARGEAPGEWSDIDLILLIDAPTSAEASDVYGMAMDASLAHGLPSALFSPQVHDPAWPAERRAIRDFFIAEVDRDRIVLYQA